MTAWEGTREARRPGGGAVQQCQPRHKILVRSCYRKIMENDVE